MAIIGRESDRGRELGDSERPKDGSSRERNCITKRFDGTVGSGLIERPELEVDSKLKAYSASISLGTVNTTLPDPLRVIMEVNFERDIRIAGDQGIDLSRTYEIYPTGDNPYTFTPPIVMEKEERITFPVSNYTNSSVDFSVFITYEEL